MPHWLPRNLFFCSVLLSLTGPLGPVTGQAQSPAVVAVRPTRHTNIAARTANVQVVFSQAISAASAAAPTGLRVFGNQLRGRRPAVLRGGGTDTLTADPTQDFAPGEVLSVSISSALQNAAGTAVSGQVVQFRAAAAGNGRGVFSPTATLASGSNTVATTLGDTDNDGDLDVVSVFRNPNSNLRSIGIRLNNGAGSFPTQSGATLSSGVTDVALGDLDADGDLDLVGVDEYSVVYEFNNGAGFFGSGNSLYAGGGCRGLALGDLDADGDLDIVITNINSNSAVLVLNNGNGSFAQGVSVPLNAPPTGLALGDFDNDGDLDAAISLAAASYGQPGSVRLLTNTGTASFTVGAAVAVGAGPGHLTAADFDNDGRLDIALANTGDFTATVLRNTGAMSFAAGPPLLLGNLPVALRAADVDADGDLDLLAATNRPGLAAVVQALNLGNATFAPAAVVPGLPAPTSLALGDLDRDGDLDLAVGQLGGTVVALNQPPLAPAIGSLTPARGVPTTRVVVRGSNLLTARSCAFNGTPALSFAVNSATQLTVEVPAGATTGPVTIVTAGGTATSPGRFRVTGPVTLTSSSPQAQALTAPVSGGVSLTFDRPIEAASAGNVAVYGSLRQGRRAGTTTVAGNTVRFQPNVPFAPGEQLTVTIPTSLDSDTTGNTTRRVFQFNAATSGLGRNAVFVPVAPVSITMSRGGLTTGDLDGDGDVDLVATFIAYVTSASTWQSFAAVRFNDGAGSFSGTQTFSLPLEPQGTRMIRLGDVDGDADLDLLVSTASNSNNSFVQEGAITVYRNNGLGVFSTPGTRVATFYDCTAFTLDDLDGDTDLDLAVVDPQSGRIELRFNDGFGGFEQAGALVCEQNSPYSGTWLFAADFDRDGDLDLVTAGSNGGANTFLNDGQGRFGAAVRSVLWTNQHVANAVVGDINGDGLPDLISNPGGVSTSGIAFHLGDGTGHFAPATAANTYQAYETYRFALGDFDADGDLDLATGGTSTYNYVTMWTNDGTGRFTYNGANSLRADERGELALVDLDGDGDLDLLSSGSGNSNGVLVALNQPSRTTSSRQAQLEAQTQLYPNPARTQVSLQLPPALNRQPLSVSVLNALGQQVLTRALPATRTAEPVSLPLTGLAQGVYTVRLTTSQGLVTKRLVVE
jgi:large repetitive protein